VRSGNGFRLHGDKGVVGRGQRRRLLIVGPAPPGAPASAMADAVSCGSPGQKASKPNARSWSISKRGAITSTMSRSMDDGCAARSDQGHHLLEGVLNIGTAARWPPKWSGLSEEVFGSTVGYLTGAQAFGRRIGEFQALQHRAARLTSTSNHPRGGAEGRCRTLIRILRIRRGGAVAKARAGFTGPHSSGPGWACEAWRPWAMTEQFEMASS